MVKLEEIDQSIVRPEESPQTQSESIGLRGHNQTGSDVWMRMLGDEGDQQEEDCYNGDHDASREPRSVETRSHAKRRKSTHITPFTDRRGYAQWPSSLVWTCPEKSGNQRHPQSDGAGNTRYQTTRAPQEDMARQTKEDMAGVGVTQDVALDRKEWRRRTMPTPRRYKNGHQGEQGEHLCMK